MNKRPTMFTHWRDLWHREAKLLGWEIAYNFDGRRIRMDRDLYKQIYRVKRIRARLDIESEVKDRSWYQLLRDITLSLLCVLAAGCGETPGGYARYHEPSEHPGLDQARIVNPEQSSLKISIKSGDAFVCELAKIAADENRRVGRLIKRIENLESRVKTLEKK